MRSCHISLPFPEFLRVLCAPFHLVVSYTVYFLIALFVKSCLKRLGAILRGGIWH